MSSKYIILCKLIFQQIRVGFWFVSTYIYIKVRLHDINVFDFVEIDTAFYQNTQNEKTAKYDMFIVIIQMN